MSTISPQRLMAAMSAAQQIKELLPYDDDNKLLIDCVDGETEVFTLLDRLAEAAIADKELAEKAAERAKRIAARAERNRDVIKAMMQALALTKIERALFTATTSLRQELVTVATNEALPSAFIRSAPDKVLIAKTLRRGEDVPGYTLADKDELTLTLRSA